VSSSSAAREPPSSDITMLAAPGEVAPEPGSVSPPPPSRRERPGPWVIRGSISPRRYWTLAALGLIVPLVGWLLLADLGAVNRVFLPTPLDVARRIGTWFREDDLLGDVQISCYRVIAGWAISALLALPLGLLIGTYRTVQALLEPLTDFIRYMPAVAFIPLVMLWIGIGEGAKIAIIFIGTFFQMVLMMAEDVRRVPMAQIEAAQTMGATRAEIIESVIIPSAKPALLDTLRITMGWAWTYLVVAELVAANSGLGYAIIKAQRFLQTDEIFAGIILIGLIGLAMDQMFRLVHRLAFPWLYARR
jgi:NitT/TauT family transport system permease protein